MAPAKHLWTNSLRVALLLLLLSMQSFTLAHELDQGVTHDSSICATCSVGSGHDGAIPVHQEGPVLIADFLLPASIDLSKPAASLRQIPEARTPPSTL